MTKMIHLIKSLEKEFTSYPESNIVFCVDVGRRSFTNAVFVMGAYMILRNNFTAMSVLAQFARMDESLIVPYVEDVYADSPFELTLLDCWRGLEKGVRLGWVRYSATPTIWGKINVSFHQHYEDVENGDMHHIVPGKLIAFRGPVQHGSSGTFDPAFYVPVFAEIGVTDIIRLNEPRYDAEDFASHGFNHHDLFLADGSYPPESVIASFLSIIDAADGLVAVHCDDGLGRTGTLVALYMMRSCGFSAREAIAWLRVVRPGSITGQHQHFLCAVHDILDRRHPRRGPAAAQQAAEAEYASEP